MQNIIKVIWLFLSIAISIWGVGSGGDANIVAIYVLGLLAFPLGLVVYVGGTFVLNLISYSNASVGITYEVQINILMYFLTILVGYFQWFVFLPKVIVWFKKRRA